METENAKVTLALEMLNWMNEHGFYGKVEICSNINENGRIKISCQARSYKAVHEFTRLFKVKFKRELSATGGCLTYIGKTQNLIVELYAISELPPRCRVVQKKVYHKAVKAHTEIINEVVCK